MNVQCPNCGGYKVKIQNQGRGCLLTYTAFLAWIPGLLGLAMFAAYLLFARNSSEGPMTLVMGTIFLAVAIGPLVLQSLLRNKDLLECEICGNKWDTSSIK